MPADPPRESLAARMARHGLGHLSLRDLARIEVCFGVALVRVTRDARPVRVAPAAFVPTDMSYAYLA